MRSSESLKTAKCRLVFEEELPGSIRVGRIIYKNGTPVHPSYPGYKPILVLTRSSPYGSIGPYLLKDEKGRIMENIWQSSKLYPWVPASKQTYSRWDSRIIWEHPQETHIDAQSKPNSKYWAWREKLGNNSEAVRYPVNNTPHRKLCMGAIKDSDVAAGEYRLLNLVDARREIYLYEYARLVKKEPQFVELQEKLSRGEKLLIIEIDGPHEEHLDYYKETYGVGDDFIENSTMLATYANLNLMMYDPAHSWGHGYALAATLRGWENDFEVPVYP